MYLDSYMPLPGIPLTSDAPPTPPSVVPPAITFHGRALRAGRIAINETRNEIWVTSGPGGWAEIVDGATNTVKQEVRIAADQWPVAYNPTNNTVYIGHSARS